MFTFSNTYKILFILIHRIYRDRWSPHSPTPKIESLASDQFDSKNIIDVSTQPLVVASLSASLSVEEDFRSTWEMALIVAGDRRKPPTEAEPGRRARTVP